MNQTSISSSAAQRIRASSLRPATRPGPDIISLASGDPDFETPAHIRQALVDAVNSGYTHYVDNQGDPELRAALARCVTGRSGRSYEASQILIAHGASGAITAAFLATINPGDRVLIPEPTYSVYADILRMIGAEPVFVPMDASFHLDFEKLEEAAPGARMVVLCNPNNPTGVVYRRDELVQLAGLATRHNLLVFSDEAYELLIFDGVEFASALCVPELADRLIYCATLSKTYAMTGWRIGYLAGPAEIIRESALMHRTINNAMNAAVQRAALVAITTESGEPEAMRREYQWRRELVVETLKRDPGFEFNAPDGSFYAFIKNPAGLTSAEMLEAALEFGVAVRSGAEYGPSGEGYFRITFATGREALQEGLNRLRLINEAALNR